MCPFANSMKPGDGTSTLSEARFASMLDTAADGIVVIDETGRILAFNKSCEALFGRSADSVLGQDVKLLMPLAYANEHDRYMSNYMSTGVRRIIGIGREVTGLHADGQEIPIELSVGEARTPEGRQFIGILRDLRSRKSVERRLSQLQAQIVHMTRLSAMDEMGAAMAHELNQPLTALMLYLQTVNRGLAAGQPASERTVDIIHRALAEAERAASIIQRMRQMLEKRDPERSPIDLRHVVDEAVDLSEFVAQGSTVAIRRRYDDAPTVDADAVQIQQIVLNLIKNAIDVARDSAARWVEVSIRVEGHRALVAVTDSGPGIAEETASQLFRTFSTTKKGGMGLGLAISRSIAQNHGGDLTADPGGDGTGATFTLSLPLGDRDKAPAPQNVAEES